jgi:hypothetical protein
MAAVGATRYVFALNRKAPVFDGTVGDLATDEHWLKAHLTCGWFGGDVSVEQLRRYVRLDCSADASKAACTHTGFIQYLFKCWAKEMGAVLRPDMIWYTILQEVARSVRASPEAFAHLFTQTPDEKQLIILVTGSPSEMDAERLSALVRKAMPEAGFADTVLNPTFPSAPPLAKYAVAATFCDMGSNFFNYETSFCGIRSLEVVGSKEEWLHLAEAIARLRTYTPSFRWSYDSQRASYEEWIQRCSTTVEDIIRHNFDISDTKRRNAFFADIFHYGDNDECDSGHDDTIVTGWARGFYNVAYDDIAGFPSHIGTIPFVNQETKREFVQAVGLAHSVLRDETVWDPQYVVVTFEKHVPTSDGSDVHTPGPPRSSDSHTVVKADDARTRAVKAPQKRSSDGGKSRLKSSLETLSVPREPPVVVPRAKRARIHAADVDGST